MWHIDWVGASDAPLCMIPDDPDVDKTAQVELLCSKVSHCQCYFETDGFIRA